MNNSVFSQIPNERGALPPLLLTSEQSGFLFLNETGVAATYKHRVRHDVRSHVRKQSAKQFRKTHKTARTRATTLPKYAPLTMQSQKSETFKHLEHDEDCLSNTSFTPRLEISTKDVDLQSDSAVPLHIHESAPDSSPSSTVGEQSERSEPQGDLTKRVYCKLCGEPYNRPKNKQRCLSKNGVLISRISKWELQNKSSLIKSMVYTRPRDPIVITRTSLLSLHPPRLPTFFQNLPQGSAGPAPQNYRYPKAERGFV